MITKCPICKKPVVYPAGKDAQKPRWLPFCSERCKFVDLGKWLDASYTIPAEPEPDDQEEGSNGTNSGNDAEDA